MIQRVESITYGVDDLEAGKRFYADWGLTPAVSGAHGIDYLLPSGQTLRLRSTADSALPSPIQPGSTLREIVWGVETREDVEELAGELAVDRTVRAEENGIRTIDPCGLGIGFAVAVGTPPRSTDHPGRTLNEPFALLERVEPFRIGHVVINVAADKFEETTAFYLERLDFRLTDRVREFGDFMRCAGSRDHHNQFLLQKIESGLNHVAFEVPRIDEIIVGGKRMQERGWSQATGLGRHIMGSNLYWYFQNPNGGLAEYFSDMDAIDDDWTTREWDVNPGFSLWTL